jgi:hypothetical protein
MRLAEKLDWKGLIVKGKGKEISGHALRVAGGWASR